MQSQIKKQCESMKRSLAFTRKVAPNYVVLWKTSCLSLPNMLIVDGFVLREEFQPDGDCLWQEVAHRALRS